ncbi:MAG: aminotransferase class V-fold PLP-dependent enzyme, partial [Pyrinomonadaceae bacterium]
ENMRGLRDFFEKSVAQRIEEIRFNGNPDQRLPNISNISFRFVEGEGLLINLDLQGVAVSTGSACSSGTLEPSPVILALGLNDESARGAIRFSLGKGTTQEDIDYVLEVLPRAVNSLRQLSPKYKEKATA